jgi:hypothetical protein
MHIYLSFMYLFSQIIFVGSDALLKSGTLLKIVSNGIYSPLYF